MKQSLMRKDGVWRMRCGLRLILMIIQTFSLPLICSAGDASGPLSVLNQFPPHMIFLTPRPHSPHLIEKQTFSGAVAFDYISVYSNAASSEYKILMDMEAMIVDLRLGYGLTDRLALWARIPAVSMQDGFMDEPLEAYHDLLDLPNYGKEKSPANTFAYRIRKNGRPWFDAEKGGLNPTDLTLSAQIELLDTQETFFTSAKPPEIGLTLEVKLPTGDEDRGFGSGAVDYGVFVPIQFSFSHFNLHAMPGYIWIGAPEFDADIPVRDIKSLFIGGEYLYSSRLCLLAQVNSYTQPFGHTGLNKLDTPSVELALGARWALKSGVGLEFAFCEDLTRAGPDFDLHLMVSFTSGRKYSIQN